MSYKSVKMKDHPIEVQGEIRKILGKNYDLNESIASLFLWPAEDANFWDRVDSGDYTEFYQRYPKKDSIVEEVREELLKRSEAGIKKYGVTLDREDIDLKGWLTHLSEELMDATLYVKRAIKDVEKEDKGFGWDAESGMVYWRGADKWAKVGDLEEEDKRFEKNMKAAEELKEANKEIEALKKDISVWREVVDKLIPYYNEKVDTVTPTSLTPQYWWNTPICRESGTINCGPSTTTTTYFSEDNITYTIDSTGNHSDK